MDKYIVITEDWLCYEAKGSELSEDDYRAAKNGYLDIIRINSDKSIHRFVSGDTWVSLSSWSELTNS